jgi:protein-L-isoaspartate(D-aspartate) O-methyltransferase
MIAEIEAEMAATADLTGRRTLSPRVLAALSKVHRDAFVPEEEAPYAFDNRPLPIGHDQTISQPFIVAIMTELLDLKADDVVLEVGTGSGYQAAILAELAHRIYTLEAIPELAVRSRAALARTGCVNVETRCGNGAAGWLEHAPFDAIIVTAAAPAIPPALIAQLRPGGRMIIPVGRAVFDQSLVLVEKSASGEVAMRDVLPVAFVPLVDRGPGTPPAASPSSPRR